MHDSQTLGQLLDDENDTDAVWGDSAYRSDTIEAVLELLQFESHIHERAYRNHPLTEQQQLDNRERSKIQAKVEHVFGNWIMTMGGKLVRSNQRPRRKRTGATRLLETNTSNRLGD